MLKVKELSFSRGERLLFSDVAFQLKKGDFIGIRQKMFLSHSYDHRVVDGALGGSFVKRVAEYLEAFDANREY
jgi:hypothetical protein